MFLHTDTFLYQKRFLVQSVATKKWDSSATKRHHLAELFKWVVEQPEFKLN